MMGMITDFDRDGYFKTGLFLTGLVKQANILSISLINTDPCGLE